MRRTTNTSQTASSTTRKGRYPKEYRSWILWEVALPLAAPLAVFIVLLGYWAATRVPEYGVRALISVSGSGDLLIFAAFLLINAGAKFRAVAETQKQTEYVTEGDLDGDMPFGIAIVFLLLYMGFRVGLEIMSSKDIDTWKFAYGSISLILIICVVIWLDCKVCDMHIKTLQRKANNGLVSNYYNT